MLTHYNIINTVRAALGVNYDPDERSVSPMPLFHIAGANFATGMTLSGATFIPMLAFDPVKLMELVDKEKGTSAFCVPAMIAAWLNNPRFQAGEFDLSSFKRIHTGGAPVPVVLMEQVREKLGADCRIYFGMTESTGAATMTRDIDSFELKSATVGKPYPNVEVKILNLTNGQIAPLGQSGELLVRGFVVMQGYYNMPERTAEAIDPEGWLHTGDLATMNPAGYVNIVGRLKELVIRGGENIYPAEIESFLMRYPKIAEAQVLGVPDKRLGEELVALLKLKPGQSATEDEVREYCRANISQFKIPRYIRFIAEFPLTASGKVKKYELKAQLIQELGLAEGAGIKTT
jgi:fatty-acyl-CoA synthase